MSDKTAKAVIGILSAIALAASLIIRNEAVSAALVLLCASAAICILYRKLPELSKISADNPKVKTLRFITVFNAAVIAALVIFAYLAENQLITLTGQSATLVLPVIFAALIIIFGNVSPKIPHNRYTGLRLPWTVSDEETWIVAHRLLGYLSLPCGVLCLTGAGNPQASIYIPLAMLFTWIIVPAVLSLIFYCRKWHVSR